MVLFFNLIWNGFIKEEIQARALSSSPALSQTPETCPLIFWFTVRNNILVYVYSVTT